MNGALHFTQHGKNGVGCGACRKRAYVSCLNNGAFGRGIGKGNTQLNKRGSCILHGKNDALGGFNIRIAAGNKGDKCSFV